MNKGLFRYEWKRNRILLISCSMIAFFTVLLLYSNMNIAKNRIVEDFSETFYAAGLYHSYSYTGMGRMVDYRLGDWAGLGAAFQGNFLEIYFWFTLFMVACAVALVMVQFMEEKLPNGEDFLLSLPVNRKMIFSNRLMHGAMVLGIPYAIFAVGALWVQAMYRPWILEYNVRSGFYNEILQNENWKVTALFLLLGALVIAAIYLMGCMFQSMCNNSFSASVLACCMIWVPMYVGNIINNMMIRFSNNTFAPYNDNWLGIFQPIKFFVATEDIVYDSVANDYVSFYTLEDFWSKVGLLAVLILFSYLIARYFYLYTEGGQNSLFRKRWMNMAYQIYISILAGLFIGRMNNMTRYGLGVTVILMALITCFVFLLLRRFQNSGRRIKNEKK